MSDEDCANLLEKLEDNKSHISALEKFNTYFETARTFYKGSQDDLGVVHEINGSQSNVAMQEKAPTFTEAKKQNLLQLAA